MKELEEKLTRLQEQHCALVQSYEILQLKCSEAKHQLKALQGDNGSRDGTQSKVVNGASVIGECDDAQTIAPNLLSFACSVFHYEKDAGLEREGLSSDVILHK
jgi:hypothetical protein